MNQNSKQQETRTFNVEHAKSGAPYACRNGDAATILKWDANNSLYPLIGYVTEGGSDYPENWTVDGECTDPSDGDNKARRNLVMLPLGYISGKPVFVGDKLVVSKSELVNGAGQEVVAQAYWTEDTPWDFYSWPALEKQYPVTGMTDRQFSSFYTAGGRYVSDMRAAANAALRHAIDSGQLVIPTVAQAYEIGRQAATENFPPRFVAYEDSPEGIAGAKRAVRDMAIAEAVRDACRSKVVQPDTDTPFVSFTTAYGWISNIDLATIVAKVP